MGRLFEDTAQEVEDELVARLRELSPRRKLEMVAEMNAAVRQLMMIGLRERHPNDTPEQLQRRMAHLLFGPELASKVFGPLE
jgi:hypothetical protein